MTTQVQCGSCGGHFRAPESAAGKQLRCPKCGGIVKPVAPNDAEDANKGMSHIHMERGVHVSAADKYGLRRRTRSQKLIGGIRRLRPVTVGVFFVGMGFLCRVIFNASLPQGGYAIERVSQLSHFQILLGTTSLVLVIAGGILSLLFGTKRETTPQGLLGIGAALVFFVLLWLGIL